jgi:hypothetical protein
VRDGGGAVVYKRRGVRGGNAHLPRPCIMFQRGRSGPLNISPDSDGVGGGANPFDHDDLLTGSADGAAEVLRLCLQGQVLLGRALELENRLFREEVGCLWERTSSQGLLAGARRDEGAAGRQPLVERIDFTGRRPPARPAFDSRYSGVPNRVTTTRSITVAVQPVGVHSRFLPLGSNFQEGGMGGPMFTQPEDWPDTVRKNIVARPRGVRQWGSHPVNLDDLHIYVQLGQMVYGGNRPPGRRDPVDPAWQWKAIEAAFFRGAVAIILQPQTFTEIRDQFTPDQLTRYTQPFLAAVNSPNDLAAKDVVQHMVWSGVAESWIRLDSVVGFAHSYLCAWARYQTEITPATVLGRLFPSYYPDGIDHQNNRDFVEDAAVTEGTGWGESAPEEVPMEDKDDDVPPLESATPSPIPGTPRVVTPEDERVDWGDDDME